MRLDALCGRGAFAEVYDGWLYHGDEDPRRVAVKLLLPQYVLSQDAARRLIAEAWVLRELKHPAFIQLIDTFHVQRRFVMVTEFVPGIDIGDLPLMPPKAAWEIVAQVASAMSLACDPGTVFIHQDIKPANLRLSEVGTVHIFDVGLALVDGSGPGASVGCIAGTPGYMSPERWHGNPPDPSADVYAVGSILYLLLSGDHLVQKPGRKLREKLVKSGTIFQSWLNIRLDQSTRPLEPHARELIERCCTYLPADRIDMADLAELCDSYGETAEGLSLEEWCASQSWDEEPDSVGFMLLEEDVEPDEG